MTARPLHAHSGQSADTVRSADGEVIHYVTAGDGPVGLIFVHGWTLDHTFWEHQMRYFSPSFRVAALDLAGHGRSGTTRTGWTMAAFGDDVAAVATALGVERVVLVGHSMGAAVVLEAEQKLGDRVAGIIYVDAFQDPDSRMTDEESKGIVQLYRADFKTNVDQMVRQYLFAPGTDSLLADRIAGHMSSFEPDIGVASIEELFASDYRARFPQVAAPQASINADLYPTNFDALARIGIDVRILEGVGHFPMVEAPDRFNVLLADVLAVLLQRGGITSPKP